MKRKERIAIEMDFITSVRGKLPKITANGTMAVPALTEDPEDDLGAEDADLDLSEEALEQQRWKWAIGRSGRSSDEEDFSDSQMWDETFEPHPTWLKKLHKGDTDEDQAVQSRKSSTRRTSLGRLSVSVHSDLGCKRSTRSVGT